MSIFKISEKTESKTMSYKRKKKCYMAGKLFSEADIKQRLYEEKELRVLHEELGVDREIFSPITSPVNDKSTLPTSKDIFSADEREVMEADVIFADLTDEDPGVMMELGMVLHKDVKIYPYLSDIRIATAGEYEGVNVPFGYNQFVIGALETYVGEVYSSFQSALEAYRKDLAENRV